MTGSRATALATVLNPMKDGNGEEMAMEELLTADGCDAKLESCVCLMRP